MENKSCNTTTDADSASDMLIGIAYVYTNTECGGRLYHIQNSPLE